MSGVLSAHSVTISANIQPLLDTIRRVPAETNRLLARESTALQKAVDGHLSAWNRSLSTGMAGVNRTFAQGLTQQRSALTLHHRTIEQAARRHGTSLTQIGAGAARQATRQAQDAGKAQTRAAEQAAQTQISIARRLAADEKRILDERLRQEKDAARQRAIIARAPREPRGTVSPGNRGGGGNAFGAVLGLAGRFAAPTALVGAVGSAFTSGVQLESVKQQAAIGLETQFGKAGSDRLLKFADRLDQKSAFSYEGAVKAIQSAGGFGFKEREIPLILQRASDRVAAKGGGAEDVGRLVDTLGKIRTTGRLQGGPVNQFAKQGVDVMGILSKATGKSLTELADLRSKGLIPAGVAIRAILDDWKKFESAGEKAARVPTIAFDNFKSALSKSAAILFKPLIDASTGWVLRFTDALQTNQGGLKRFADGVVTVVKPIAQTLQTGFTATVSWFTTNWPKIQTISKSVFEGVVTFGKNAFTGIMAVARPVGRFIADQFGFVVTWVRTNWPLMVRTVQTVVGTVQELWKAHGARLVAVIRPVWEIIKAVVSGALKVITGAFTFGMDVITGNWKGAFGSLKGIVQVQFKTVVSVLKSALVGIGNLIVLAFEALGDAGGRVFKAGYGIGVAIRKGLISGLQNVGQALVDAIAGKPATFTDNNRRALSGLESYRSQLQNSGFAVNSVPDRDTLKRLGVPWFAAPGRPNLDLLLGSVGPNGKRGGGTLDAEIARLRAASVSPVVAGTDEETRRRLAAATRQAGTRQMGGSVAFRVGADQARVSPALLADLKRAAADLGFQLGVGTAITGHSRLTTSGNISRHGSGAAVDINSINGVTFSSNPKAFTTLGDKLAAYLQGKGFARNVESGNNQAVLWGFNDPARGGNHLNHLHVSNRGGTVTGAGTGTGAAFGSDLFSGKGSVGDQLNAGIAAGEAKKEAVKAAKKQEREAEAARKKALRDAERAARLEAQAYITANTSIVKSTQDRFLVQKRELDLFVGRLRKAGVDESTRNKVFSVGLGKIRADRDKFYGDIRKKRQETFNEGEDRKQEYLYGANQTTAATYAAYLKKRLADYKQYSVEWIRISNDLLDVQKKADAAQKKEQTKQTRALIIDPLRTGLGHFAAGVKGPVEQMQAAVKARAKIDADAKQAAAQSKAITDRLNESLADVQVRYREVAGSGNLYAATLARLNVANKALTVEQRNLVSEMVHVEQMTQRLEARRSSLFSIGQSVSGLFANAFEGVLTKQKNFAQSFVQGFKQMLTRLVAEWAANRAAQGLIGLFDRQAARGLGDSTLSGFGRGGNGNGSQRPGLDTTSVLGVLGAGVGLFGGKGQGGTNASVFPGTPPFVEGRGSSVLDALGGLLGGSSASRGGFRGLPAGVVPVYIVGSAQSGGKGGGIGGGKSGGVDWLGVAGAAASFFPGAAPFVAPAMMLGRALGFAKGGFPPVNVPSIVGENGPELIVPTQRTRVYNRRDTQDILSGPNRGGDYHLHVNEMYQASDAGQIMDMFAGSIERRMRTRY